MLKVTTAASEVAAERMNNRTSKEDVRHVSSHRFWPELTFVYEIRLFCDVAHVQTYTALLGVHGADCTPFYCFWGRGFDWRLKTGYAAMYITFIQFFFPTLEHSLWKRVSTSTGIFIKKKKPSSVWCYVQGYIVIEILSLNILVEHKRDMSTAIPKHNIFYACLQELTR